MLLADLLSRRAIAMNLQEHFLNSGAWLFRWRSYLPVLLLSIALLGLQGFHYPAGSHALDVLWEIFCFLVGLWGLAIRILTVGYTPAGTSARSTRKPIAAELNTTGMYSIVRHPLYLGNYFLWLAVALLPLAWWVPVITTLAFWLYYERIIFAEEAFLQQKFGDDFLRWAARTPTFLPSLRLWKPPRLCFSLYTVLKREISGLFALVVAINVFEVAEDLVVEGKLEIDVFWAAVLGCTTLLYGLSVVAKKKRLLEVEGR
jgi:protein-S-isoprenylcysteine O-methyltransferase Ste14